MKTMVDDYWYSLSKLWHLSVLVLSVLAGEEDTLVCWKARQSWLFAVLRDRQESKIWLTCFQPLSDSGKQWASTLQAEPPRMDVGMGRGMLAWKQWMWEHGKASKSVVISYSLLVDGFVAVFFLLRMIKMDFVLIFKFLSKFTLSRERI